jgi:hypothetical protein
MKLRFTIRDLFWLTLVVALAVGWWIDAKELRWLRAEKEGIEQMRALRP